MDDLQGRVPLTQSALSQHLARLRAQHLVATRRQAQTTYYRVIGEEAAIMAPALLRLIALHAQEPPVVEGDRIGHARATDAH